MTKTITDNYQTLESILIFEYQLQTNDNFDSSSLIPLYINLRIAKSSYLFYLFEHILNFFF
jgi:hypothetical protein